MQHDLAPADLALFRSVEAGDAAGVRAALVAGASARALRTVETVVDRDRVELDETALQVAIRNRAAAVIAVLLEHGADPTRVAYGGDDAFAAAIGTGDRDVIAAFTAAGAPASARALDLACHRGSIELADACRRSGVTPANTPVLATAARGGHVPLLAWVLAHGGDVATEGVAALCEAANAGHPAACTFLVQHGVPIDCRNEYAWPPLHFAAWNADVATVQALLAAGADPAATCGQGRTAASWAEEAGKADVVACLRAAESR